MSHGVSGKNTGKKRYGSNSRVVVTTDWCEADGRGEANQERF